MNKLNESFIMKNAMILSLSAFLVIMTVSCKEQKQQEPPAKAPAPPSVNKQPVQKLTAEEKRLKEGNKKLGWVMQDLDIPEYKLDRLHKKGELMSESYVKYAEEIIKVAKTIKDVDHPDEKLTGFAGKMLEAMTEYEAAFKSKDTEKIKTSWAALKNSCAACHKVYRKDTGGY